MTFASSTTRPVSTGKFAAKAIKLASIITAISAILVKPKVDPIAQPCGLPSELHFRRSFRARSGGKFLHRFVRSEDGRRPQHAWEGPEHGVVGAYGLDVVSARYGDAILRALELRLQR